MNGHQKQREQSRSVIENALFALLKEKEWETISVAEIVKKADRGRRTFYRLYQGKEDILHQYFMRLRQEYKGNCGVLKNYDFDTIAVEYFQFWHSHKELLLLLYRRGMEDLLFYEIGWASREVVESRILDTGQKKSGKAVHFADYSAGGFWMLLYRWLEEGMNGTPEAYACEVCSDLRKFIQPAAGGGMGNAWSTRWNSPAVWRRTDSEPQCCWAAVSRRLGKSLSYPIAIGSGISKRDWFEAERREERAMRFHNIYFINGTAYAGKSTMVKRLAEKYQGIACEENYQDSLLADLRKEEFPCLTYTRDLRNWSDFIRRTPDEYEAWVHGCIRECTILELKLLETLEAQGRKVFVDTNIPVEVLKQISDRNHVVIMLADPDISVKRFFERPDKEKQFLYQLLLKEDDPDKAMVNFRECLKRINSQENYNDFLHSGFPVVLRDEQRSVEETLLIVETMFHMCGGTVS